MLLVNADDFGLSPQVNTAISLAYQSGLVSTCTIMANGPAFEDACELAHANGLTAHAGLHFVLDEGFPLSHELRREPRFCTPEGNLIPRRPGALMWLSLTERRAVGAELRAQIARCRSVGFVLSHIDSHHHVHEELGIISVILPIMREQGIHFIRPMQNLRKCRRPLRRAYTCMFNTSLRLQRVEWTRYFGTVADFLHFVQLHGRPPQNGSTELMVHPVTGLNGEVFDKGQGRDLSATIYDVAQYWTPVPLKPHLKAG